MQAFSYHSDENYEESRASAQRYIDFYPTDEDAAYAQYLLALSYYDQIDEVGRDQGLTFQALQSLRTVIEVYPDSEYATSSVLKFDLAFDHLAGKEMEIPEARVYERSHWVRTPVRASGFFFPAVGLGDVVKIGDLLGTIIDPLTDATSRVTSTHEGEIIGMAVPQPVLPGYALFHLAWHE